MPHIVATLGESLFPKIDLICKKVVDYAIFKISVMYLLVTNKSMCVPFCGVGQWVERRVEVSHPFGVPTLPLSCLRPLRVLDRLPQFR